LALIKLKLNRKASENVFLTTPSTIKLL